MTNRSTGRVLEIACDESGSEGEKLIGGETDVFAHASVLLDVHSATECIEEIRNRIRSPALEYKSNHLLRTKHRPVLEWLLRPAGPIHGHAHVHLTDKAFFAVRKVIDLLDGGVSSTAGTGNHRAEAMVRTLFDDGRRAFGRERWEDFLGAFNDLLRVKNRQGVGTSVDAFFRMADALCLASPHGLLREIMELLRHARPRIDALRTELLDNPGTLPVLDPLIPAVRQAVAYWGAGGRPVAIVHDEQLSLTEGRIAQLKDSCRPRGRLASLRLVDSRSDPRVQVADFLAGVARKIASEELNHRGDAQLTALLRPYVDLFSIWGDDRSWSLLAPTFPSRPARVVSAADG